MVETYLDSIYNKCSYTAHSKAPVEHSESVFSIGLARKLIGVQRLSGVLAGLRSQ